MPFSRCPSPPPPISGDGRGACAFSGSFGRTDRRATVRESAKCDVMPRLGSPRPTKSAPPQSHLHSPLFSTPTPTRLHLVFTSSRSISLHLGSAPQQRLLPFAWDPALSLTAHCPAQHAPPSLKASTHPTPCRTVPLPHGIATPSAVASPAACSPSTSSDLLQRMRNATPPPWTRP